MGVRQGSVGQSPPSAGRPARLPPLSLNSRVALACAGQSRHTPFVRTRTLPKLSAAPPSVMAPTSAAAGSFPPQQAASASASRLVAADPPAAADTGTAVRPSFTVHPAFHLERKWSVTAQLRGSVVAIPSPPPLPMLDESDSYDGARVRSFVVPAHFLLGDRDEWQARTVPGAHVAAIEQRVWQRQQHGPGSFTPSSLRPDRPHECRDCTTDFLARYLCFVPFYSVQSVRSVFRCPASRLGVGCTAATAGPVCFRVGVHAHGLQSERWHRRGWRRAHRTLLSTDSIPWTGCGGAACRPAAG
jgi:hypothetical protein